VLRGPAGLGVLGASGVLAAARLAPGSPGCSPGSAIFLAVGFWTAYRPWFRAADAPSCPVRAGRAVRVILWVAAALIVTAAVMQEFLA
jgi:hypothetical protein